jgi:hypothetical protein
MRILPTRCTVAAPVRAAISSPAAARVAVFAGDLHFDQLVSGEGALDFGDQRLRHAGTARLDHGFQAVCPGLQVGAFAGRQCRGPHYPPGAVPALVPSRQAASLADPASRRSVWRPQERTARRGAVLPSAGGIGCRYFLAGSRSFSVFRNATIASTASSSRPRSPSGTPTSRSRFTFRVTSGAGQFADGTSRVL